MTGPSAWPTVDGIREAAGALAPYLAPTPLVRSELFSRALAADVWLKNETVTPIASFKLRGALTALRRAAAAGPVNRAVTSSTGNHGQGVAYAAKLLDLHADIFLPEIANPVKKAMIEAFGGTVHLYGKDIDAAKDQAKSLVAETGGCFVDDGDSVDVMEGAGTVGLEIAEALEGIECLLVPIGGGNLVSGCATALKAVQPSAQVVAVQAKGAPAMVESFHAREALERDIDTIADGLECRVPAPLALAVMWERVDDAWLVSDEDLLAGVHALAECAHVLVEPAGAATLAGAWRHREQLAGKRVVLILSGANATVEQLRGALATPPLIALDDVAAHA
jgi:threonine dehydratase